VSSSARPPFDAWGAHRPEVPAAAEEFLRRELDLPAGVRREPVGLAGVRLRESALPAAARAAFAAAGASVRDDAQARVLRAAGKSYPDLVRMRAGDLSEAPDAVVLPPDADAVSAVLAACAEHGVAVVPFGGGTSVVGGVAPERGGFAAVIALDLERLDGLRDVDERSLLVSVEGGVRLPELERRLGERGLTLGHFPQSFEYVSVGGAVATRSAGQASTGYGRIDELVEGVRLDAPAGTLDLAPLPASAAGPELRELVVGSEGVLGVITRADLRVRPVPAERRYEGFAFASFAEGIEALRRVEQLRAAPDVARLSDEDETRVALAQSGGGRVAALAGAYLRVRGVAGGCVAICGWEGEPDEVARRRARTVALLKAGGAVPLGQRPGRSWLRGRYEGPYLRDALLDRGVFVETLETAATWSHLPAVYRAVRGALAGALGPASLVLCHVSHLYPSGASLYFTFLAREAADPLAQWRAAKRAATDAIVASGATITHHHAVGRDHAEWLPAEAGELGVRALRALKRELDPAGIMNPGKLLPPG
jgi:alkyldihydroxyacetonephosphate synthase